MISYEYGIEVRRDQGVVANGNQLLNVSQEYWYNGIPLICCIYFFFVLLIQRSSILPFENYFFVAYFMFYWFLLPEKVAS